MLKIKLTDIVMAFSNSIDMICPSMAHHHKRVAYIAYQISTQMGLERKDIENILIAALLHDCGAIKDDEKLRTGHYDFGITLSERFAHGFRGWMLLKGLEDFKKPAELIKFHHVYWKEPEPLYIGTDIIPVGSYILHLADRIDIFVNKQKEVLSQRSFIIDTIREDSGKKFMPEAVEAFLEISSRESFWFDMVTPFLDQLLIKYLSSIKSTINIDKLLLVAGILNKIIDYRSSFTSTHSAGVAECAGALSLRMGFSNNYVKMMYIAGLLHDLGKLAIPVRILEKKGPLDKNELNIMKQHTFLSYRVLESIPQLTLINQWASYHHERVDGTGYPFRIGGKDLGLGSRIMAVSDVFTALTEDRPYRAAMPVNAAIKTMEEMVRANHLDADVFSALNQHIEEINQLKLNAQKNAVSSFMNLQSSSA